jgi:tetratricopeptide (TPR) repeat protein
MEVLLCLASNPGELVSRDALLETVWGKDHGSQETLNHAVSEIRRALDDHPDKPVYVQTLPKRGYRLLVDVQAADGQDTTVVLGTNSDAFLSDSGLFENLKRRGVLETGLAYLVVGWLLIQIADIIFAQLLLPPWLGTFVTVLVIAGFPIAILLSWFLEFRDGRAIPHELSPRDSVTRRFGRTYLSVIGALAIAGIFVFVYDQSIGLPQAENVQSGPSVYLPPVLQNSIAVLPFLNMDGTEETQIFANGLVDDVITRLSHVPGLLVPSRGDSFSLEPNSTSERVRERLRVALYLEGSVQFVGDNLRVTVQLINSETGFHMLARTFDRPLKNYFEVRDEITDLAVANVRVALPPETRDISILGVRDPSIDVYVLYRRGIEAARQADIEGSIDEALGWFDAALEIDPEYAAAYAGKCDVHIEAYIYSDDTSHVAAAETFCAKALALNPNLDIVYTSLGDLHTAMGRNDLAEQAYLDALEIDANNAKALTGLGEVYRLQQRTAEAEESIRKAIGLHPGDWATYNALGLFLFRSGRYDEAAEQFRMMVTLDDANARAHTNLASALMQAEQFEAAEPAYRRAIELDPSAWAYSSLGMLLYNQGRFEEAVEAHRNAVDLAPQDYLSRSNLGDALRASGRTTEAVETFRIARELALDARQVNPNDGFILMDLAWMNAVLGDDDEARIQIERAMQLVPDDPYVYYIDALVSNERADSERSLKSLESAVTLGYSTKLLSRDPNLVNLRTDPRFIALLD